MPFLLFLCVIQPLTVPTQKRRTTAFIFHKMALAFICLLPGWNATAQSFNVPIGNDYRHLVLRMTQTGDTIPYNLHTSVQPFDRSEVIEIIDNYQPNSAVDRFNLRYLRNDHFLWYDSGIDTRNPILGSFFDHPAALYSIKRNNFKLLVNPVIHAEGLYSAQDSLSPFTNTRGVEIAGQIGSKVGFYSTVLENQRRFPSYLDQDIQTRDAVPQSGFYKPFGARAYDYFFARGYFTFSPIKQIHVQAGHDQNFIGNGVRSLVLSDRSKPHLFLKVRTQIWRFQYTNLFSEWSDLRMQTGGGSGQSKKFSATHHLSINLGKKWNIGLFETIVQGPDSTELIQPDANYWNPIIFYRAVEHGLNSRDNVLVGLDARYQASKGLTFYTQVLLDEFVKDELVQRTGWWGNKWGLQVGGRYFNVLGIENLDLQVEWNGVRPYTYTHFRKSQNYVNHNYPMAHPAGAGFSEGLGILRYQVSPRLNLVLKGFIRHQGIDSAGLNYGNNILLTYQNRPGNYDIPLVHGTKQVTRFVEARFSYQIFQNMFMDAIARYRLETIMEMRNEEIWLGVGLRINRPLQAFAQ